MESYCVQNIVIYECNCSPAETGFHKFTNQFMTAPTVCTLS